MATLLLLLFVTAQIVENLASARIKGCMTMCEKRREGKQSSFGVHCRAAEGAMALQQGAD